MRRLCLVLLPAVASSLLAQAPVITPAGDPSVRSDTIYRLAVNPADYPDEAYVYLLDDGVVRFEADGRGVRTYRQVIQVLKQEAAERFGEQVFSYSRSRERLTVNWLRVVRPDGSVVSDSAVHQQESDAPTALSAPVYSDQRLHRATLGGVAPGTIVDWSYTVETVDPVMPGDFLTTWRITVGRPVRRSRFVLDVPASLSPRLTERNVRVPRRISESHGRRVYVWAAQDVPRVPDPEPLAADSGDYEADITVTSPESWGDVARWYAGLARDRYAVTPALNARLAEVVRGQRTRDDSLRALYRWVAQDFRYVSVALGLAGYQPRPPAEVLETQYGDCKDKATLLVALAQQLGFRAYPVLVSVFGGIDSSAVSTGQFNHMIAAVERPGGYLYLDPTAEIVPVGMIPPSEQGGFGLLVHPDGRGEPVRLPLDSVAANRSESALVGELSADGIFAGRLTQTFQGTAQLGVRAGLSRDIPAAQRAAMARGIAGSVFDGATGDSLELFDGRDLGAPARISLVIRDGRAANSSGATEILSLPIRPAISPRLAAELAAHTPRRFHIDASEVFGLGDRVSEVRLTLPEGWRARLPAGVNVSSAFGTYTASYTQEGRQLRVVRRSTGARGVFPGDRVAELLAFLRAVGRDDARYVILEH